MDLNKTLASPADSLPLAVRRTAVFDLDGTLADTSADLIAAANAVLAAAGAPRRLDPQRDRRIAFAGGRAMLRAGLGDADAEGVERLFPRLLEAYGSALRVETELYDGVEAALDALSARGWTLAVCTNKPVGLAEALLTALGLAPRFAATLGADSLPVRKPDPRHLTETIRRAGGVSGRAVLVGDTATDRAAARAAGIPCVLVGFGPEGAAVTDLGPEAVLDHYADLPTLLDRLLPE